MAAQIESKGPLYGRQEVKHEQDQAVHLAYWKHYLAGAPAGVPLPTDYPRPPGPATRAACQPFLLPARLSKALQALSQEEAAPLSSTLLAAFAVLLFRYSSQEDMVIGASASEHAPSHARQLLSVPANTLPLRVDLSDTPSFRMLIQRVCQAARSSLDHTDRPPETLIRALQAQHLLDQNQPFQVCFTYGAASSASPASQADTRRAAPDQPFAADLKLALEDSPEGLTGQFAYNADLFDAAAIQRVVGHWQTLLEGVIADPDRSIAVLPLLTDAERQHILMDWNATQVSYPTHLALHQLVEQQVARSPGAVAVVYEDTTLSYQELNQRANQLAHYLQARGVGPDVPVGVYMERSLEMVVGLLGILKAGGAYVPLDPGYPRDRLSFMLEDSQVPALLTQARLADTLPMCRAQIVCLDADWGHIAREDTANPASGVAPDNLAYIIYTSGSTGKPKGAMNTHSGVCNRLLWMQDEYHLTPADRVLQKTPFSFDVSVWEFFWPLMTGAQLVIARPEGHKDSAYLRAIIAARQITTIHFVPSMLQIFLGETGLEKCQSLRQVFCSGEALPYELQERYFQQFSAPLHNLYGPTEAAVDVTYWACKPENGRRIVPIGRPIANTQIYLLDHAAQPVPIGVPGELHIGGVGLARGYLNRPELTAERFIPNPFSAEPGARLYKTGDLARYRPDGTIEYIGRTDYQVKIRGFRIELGEIEAALAQHPAVREALVVAGEETLEEKRLIAYIVPEKPTERLSLASLREALAAKLPDYMIPAFFIVLKALPLNPNGKVDRRALPAPDTTNILRDGVIDLPGTPTETKIAEILAAHLKLTQIGRDENFFMIGGNSLSGTQAIAQIANTFGVDLSLQVLGYAPTVRELAAEVERLIIARIQMMSEEEAQHLLGG